MMRIEDFTQYLLWEKKYSPHTVEAYGTDLSEFEGFLVSMQAPAEDASIDFQAVRAWVVHLMEQGYTYIGYFYTSQFQKASSLQ